MSSRLRFVKVDEEKPSNSSRGKGLILETPYKPGFVEDKDLETVKMAVDKEFSEISNAFHQTTERTADTITRVDKIEIETDGIGAKIEEVDKVSKEGDKALAERITTFEAKVDGEFGEVNAKIVETNRVMAEQDGILAEKIESISGAFEGELGPLIASIDEVRKISIDGDKALATSISDLKVEMQTADSKLEASISTESTARVEADKAQTEQLNTATSKLDGQIASVQQYASTEITKLDGEVNRINSKWGVQTNVNGKVSGIQLNNDGASSSFDVVADRFTISDGTSNTNPPFQVVGGHTRIMSAFINSLQSDNWDGGANGWAILNNGNAYFNNVTVRGTVHASTFTGVGAISSLASAGYGGSQSSTNEISLGAGSVTNTSNEVVLCISEYFGLELYGHCEVAVRSRNRTTGAYNTRYVKGILPDGQMSTTACAITVDVSPNSSQSIEITVQKIGGTGYWSSSNGHVVRGLHRKYS